VVPERAFAILFAFSSDALGCPAERILVL